MDELPDYTKYTLDELYDVRDHVDKDKYPKRYEFIIQEIIRRQKDLVSENHSKNSAEIIVRRIRYIYYILIVFTLGGVTLALQYWKSDFSIYIGAGVKVIAYILICYGLLRLKQWVIPLALIVSALGIINEVFTLYIPSENSFGIIIKLICVLIICFYIYQIYFFRKKEIARFFKSGNTDIF